MQSGNPQICYGPGPEGYEVLSESGEISDRSRSAIIDFCKSVSWRPEKLDFPEQSCIALVPDGDFAWLCHLEEGDRDKFGRGLSLSVTATRFDCSEEALKEGLRRLADLQSLEKVTLHFDSEDALVDTVIVNHPELVSIMEGSMPSKRHRGSPEAPSRPAGRREMPSNKKQNTAEAMKNTPSTAGSRFRPIRNGFLLLCAGGVIGGVLALWFVAVPQKSKLSDLEGSLRDTFLTEGTIDEASIRQAYHDYAESTSAIREKVDAWKRAALELHPDARSPERFLQEANNVAEENSRLAEELERAREGLSDDDLLSLKVLKSADELQDALLANQRAAEELQELLYKSERQPPKEAIRRGTVPER